MPTASPTPPSSRRAAPRPWRDTPPMPVKQPAVPPPPNWLGKLDLAGLQPLQDHPALRLHRMARRPRWGTCRHFHDGLDIGGPTGVPVLAAAAGHGHLRRLEEEGDGRRAGGIVVWISHGGGTLYTTYNHLSAVTSERSASASLAGAACRQHRRERGSDGYAPAFRGVVCYP